jgi:hypothetical protein
MLNLFSVEAALVSVFLHVLYYMIFGVERCWEFEIFQI